MEAQGVIITQEQNYAGTYQAPHICPGCGKCRDCGRPYEATPIPTYPQPIWIWSSPYVPNNGTITMSTTPCGGLGAASAQPGYFN